MNSMHRQVGKLTRKSPGDSSKVSVLLQDFEDANSTLTKIIEASKGWRDAWVSILSSQLGTVTCFEELYQPIVGTSDAHRDDPTLTPREILDRTSSLKETYRDLKNELLEEVIMMDARVIKPATDAREFLQPFRKTIKKRDNKRLDWERYIDKVNSGQRKMKRTDRENAALAKAEQELAHAAEAFKVADDQLRVALPPIIVSAFSILPHLLSVQIMIQNTLLAQYYTSLHNYCEDAAFPSPPPPMVDVIATWSQDFMPIKADAESINILARGRAVHQSMSLGDDASGRSKSTTGLSIRNNFANRRTSSAQNLSGNRDVSPNPQARVMRIPSHTLTSPPEHSQSPSPEPSSAHLTPGSSYSAYSPAGPTGDYFQRAAIQKKKPPPPPPKRIASGTPGLFAVASYAFEGQGDGDLSFREGDRIRVIKKTDSTDDWWQGELNGVRGSFPANYCKLA